MSPDKGGLEEVPRYWVEAPKDGTQARVQLHIVLPGVTSSSDISFRVEGGQCFVVHVPGRYRADIPLGVAVEPHAERVQFVRKESVLRASLVVAQQQQQPAAASGSGASAAAAAATPMQHERPAPGLQREGSTPAPGVSASQSTSELGEAPTDPSAVPAAGVASPREQLDAARYAAAKQYSNREAAAECYQRAHHCLRAGEAQRALRLLSKACQLDPDNAEYAEALRVATVQAGRNGQGAAAEASADGGSSGSADAAGGRGTQAGSTASSNSQRRQRAQSEQQEEGQAAAAEPPHASSRAPLAAMLRIGAGALLALAVQLAAFYAFYLLAPSAAPTGDAEAAAVAGGVRRIMGRAAAVLLFLPRVLLWSPSWKAAALWALGCGASCAVLRSADHAQQARRRPDVFRADVYVVGMIVAWHPLLWWACGGGWGAVLGTLAEVLPIARLLGTSVWGHIALYPAACFVLRLLLPPTLPYLRIGAAPLLWVLRVAVWQPRLWLSGPMAVGLFLASDRAAKQPGDVLSGYYMQGMYLVATWWLSGGGWWAVAHTVALAGTWAGLVVSNGRYEELHSLLLHHLLYVPGPLFVLRAVWSLLVGPLSSWALLTGGGAAWLLYKHLQRGVRPRFGSATGRGGGARRQPSGSSGGGGGGAGTPAAHLHNTVPAGAPDAVARILVAGNYYQVLGLTTEADEAAIKRAKRTLSLATHPDKIGSAPGANDAFNLVTEASDVLGDPSSRQQYDRELQDTALSSGFNFSPEDLAASGIPPEWADRMQEFMEAVDSGDLPQQCGNCGGLHFMRRTNRPVMAARQCDECGTRHAVRQNEVWFEAVSAGFMRRTIHMFCCYKGAVYDMSEAGECEGTLQMIHERRFPLNKHINFFKGFGLSTGGGGGGGGGGGRKAKQAQPPPRSQGPRGASNKKKGRRR